MGYFDRDCTHNTSVVLEVQEDTVGALPGLGLANDDGGVDLLSELGLSLLDGGHAVERAVSAKEIIGTGHRIGRAKFVRRGSRVLR